MSDPHAAYRETLYGQFARIGSALASEKRLELVDLLAQAPRHVDALATETGMSVANVSQHLQVLRNARLVESQRDGNRVVYRLADDSVRNLWVAVRAVGAARLAELEHLTREFAVPDAGDDDLSRDAARRLLADDRILLLDVRPPIEYASGHLPGAISLPVDELPNRIAGLPRDRRIVAYCRGHYCLFADEAVATLRRRGFDAVRLDGGWLEWNAEDRAEVEASRGPAVAGSLREPNTPSEI